MAISGTTTGVEDGQILTVTLNGKDYQATVSGNAWSVDVPAADVQALAESNHSVTALGESNHSVTANVTNAVGVAAAEASKAIIHSTAPLTITLDDTALTAGETATVTFTFHEAVTGFDNSDITVEGGTLSTVTSADDGITWTATFTPTADIKDATNLIKVGYDWTYVSSGNAPAVEQLNAAFTTVAPAGVTVSGIGNSITKTAPSWHNAGTFSDQVITADGSVSTTVAETNTARTIGLSDIDTNLLYSSIDYALRLRSDGSLSVYENGDNRGWFGTYSSGDVLSVERTGSTITYLKNGSVFYTSTVASTGDLHVDTSLSSEGATLNDIVIKGDNLTAGATDFTANSANFSVDTVTPPLTITLDDTALAAGETATVTFTFNDAVTGFDNSDITVEGGTLSAVTSADDGITWTATFTPTADISDSH